MQAARRATIEGGDGLRREPDEVASGEAVTWRTGVAALLVREGDHGYRQGTPPGVMSGLSPDRPHPTRRTRKRARKDAACRRRRTTPAQEQAWADTQRRHRLSPAHVRMAPRAGAGTRRSSARSTMIGRSRG